MHLWDEHKRTDQERENGGVVATYYSTRSGEKHEDGARSPCPDLVKAWDEATHNERAEGKNMDATS